MAEAREEAPQATRLGAAALLLATSVLLSRVLGYAREALLAYRVGAGASTDAYYAAFQIPDLLNYLLAGGALSIAFLPLYTRHLARGDVETADRLLASVLGTLGAAAVLATILLWWFAEPLVAFQFRRFDPATLELTVRLTRIVLPAQVFFVVGGIVNATLLARGRFRASAAAPLLYNAAILCGGLFLAPRLSDPVEGFSWGALAGAALGPLLAPLADARGRVRIRWRIAPADRLFLGYLMVAAPLMLGQSLLTVDEWYERWFGQLYGTGAIGHLGYARRLMLVPVAVVGQAIAAAALPTLARLWAEGRREDLDRVLLRTLQAAMALAALVSAGFLALSSPLVRIVYEHGAFTVSDTETVSVLLSVLCIAVPGWITQQIAVRAFYARGDTLRPMLLGTALAIAAVPLYLILGQRLGVVGLAAAGAIGMSANALATLVLARCVHGGPPLGTLLLTAGRAGLAAGLAAGAATLAMSGLRFEGDLEALAELATGGSAFAAVAVAATWLIGDRPMRDLLVRFVRRRRSAPSGGS